MNENNTNDEIEIDLKAIFKLLRKNIRMILLATLLCAIITFLITVFFMIPNYASIARIYLKPNITEQGIVDSTALNSNSKMVNNYVSLMQGETILSKVAYNLNIGDVNEIKKSLTVSNESNTEIITVKVISDDAVKSQAIAKEIVEVFFQEMQEKLDIKNMTISDEPKVSEAPVSPNKMRNTLIGSVLGMFCSCSYIFLQYLFDKRLKHKAEAESFLGFPVLGEIPWFEE